MEWDRFRLETQPPRFECRRSIDRRSGGIRDQPSEAIVCLCVCLGNDGHGGVVCSLPRLPDPLHFVPTVVTCRRLSGKSNSVCGRPLCPQFVKKKGTCSTRSLFASCPRQALHACITASSGQGLGTMAQVGLFDMSASIAGVIPRHFSYVDPASAIPPLNAEASAARALAAYPPDHAG